LLPSGRPNRNDVIVRHAVEAAEMELADRRVFVIDDAAWTQLQDLLSAPPSPSEAMVKLLSNPSVLERPAYVGVRVLLIHA
jgi:uncharacterized protein (DUF1778 family)